MNARQLKYAFLHKVAVFTDDKEHPVRNGVVQSVMYTLSDSGKKRCDADIRDLEMPNEVNKTHCRHVHFKVKPTDTPRGAAVNADKPPSAHAENIRRAFMEGQPVMIVIPGMEPTECAYIRAFLYTRNRSGKIICSCICVDRNREDSTMQARIGYVFTKSEFAEKGIEKER